MRLFDLTLPTPEANLAVDEALLNVSEQRQDRGVGHYANVLRLWESPSPFVVIGRGTRRSLEINVAACEQRGVPILRRCSGGTSVVAGPGCLMYAVVLSYQQYPELRGVDAAHQFVMGRMQQALLTLDSRIQFRGSSDLALAGQKISGNSLRCKREHLLYHGTILYDFALPLIQELLGTPPRMPEYRDARNHTDFVTNFPHEASAIRDAIVRAWQANKKLDEWPEAETEQLVREQYLTRDWNERL